jgi:hypothetical protein
MAGPHFSNHRVGRLEFEPAIGVTVVYPSALGTEFMLACTQTEKSRAGKGARKQAKQA